MSTTLEKLQDHLPKTAIYTGMSVVTFKRLATKRIGDFSGVNCVQAPTEDKVHGKPGCAPSIETFTPCWPTGVHHLRKRGGKSVQRIGKRGTNYDPLPKKRHAIEKSN